VIFVDEDKELLETMKLRILRSFRWREDVVVPLATELEITIEELEKIFMNHLDMSSLEALHSTFESARTNCLSEKLHSDLRLCWLCDVLRIITEEEANEIKVKLVKEIINGKDYEEVLKDGKKQILNFLQ
jgi:energy-converting hydrogenase A subunit M